MEMGEEARLEDSGTELLRAVIVNLAEGVLIYDSEGRVVTANPAAEAILGRPLAQLIGTRPSDRSCVASPEDPAAWPVDRHPPLETLTTGQAHRSVLKGVLRPDGRRVWISISTALVDLPAAYGGRGVVGSFVDVTAEVDARHALEKSEQRFRDLTELSADWYWEQDDQYRFIDMSIGSQSMGIAPGHFIGKKRWDFNWHNMTPADWAAHRAQLDRREPFRNLELRRRDDKGGLVVISVSGKPVYDAQGRFTGYRGVGRNITERKRTKRSLREVAERFRSLTELSSDWYWEMDAGLRFTYVSEGIRKVRGIGPETLIGRKRWDSDRVGGDEEMDRHRATLEAHLPFKDFVLARDITERMHAEEKLARMAHYDALTGLPNRALLQGRLARAMSRARPGAADTVHSACRRYRPDRRYRRMGAARGLPPGEKLARCRPGPAHRCRQSLAAPVPPEEPGQHGGGDPRRDRAAAGASRT